ncbi:phosphoribosyltransferase [Mycoplasmatota bacterium WC44]
MYKNRYDAGEKLAKKLTQFTEDNPLVLAVPRGGLVTAYETIKEFNFEWDLIIPRKIGAPHNKEIAIGAVTSDGNFLLDRHQINMLQIPQDYIEKEAYEQTKEIKRRLSMYKGNEQFPNVKNRTVIIVDDGIATGFTILAAIESVKKHGAKKVILSVPVGPKDTISRLEDIVDQVICPYIPEHFFAVGRYYDDFTQTEDDEVFEIINKLRSQ